MALDINAVPAHLAWGGVPSADRNLSPSLAVHLLAAGDDYTDPDAPLRCPERTKKGEPCKAFAGVSGLCIGHQKVADAQDKREP